jgi:hypothetical protein
MKIARRNDLSLRLLEVFGTLMLCRTTTAAAEELGIIMVFTGMRHFRH